MSLCHNSLLKTTYSKSFGIHQFLTPLPYLPDVIVKIMITIIVKIS